jgi:hypothetical protein
VSDYLTITTNSGVEGESDLTHWGFALSALLSAGLLPVPLDWRIELHSDERELLVSCIPNANPLEIGCLFLIRCLHLLEPAGYREKTASNHIGYAK